MELFNKVIISKEEYNQLLLHKSRIDSFNPLLEKTLEENRALKEEVEKAREAIERVEQLNSIEKILPSSGLQGYSDEVIHDIQQVIKSAKNTLLLQAGRINKLEDIIYRNGGSDTCDVIIKIMNNRKKGGVDYNKRTGEVIQ